MNSDAKTRRYDDRYPKVYLYKRIVYAKLFIDEHFADKIDLDNIADEAFFSKFHFIRLFRSVYNKTPYQYLSNVRIENAKKLLGNNVAVADVCYQIGFESIGSFTALFKRATGNTPAAYRATQQRNKIAIAASPLKYIPNCFAEKKGWKHV